MQLRRSTILGVSGALSLSVLWYSQSVTRRSVARWLRPVTPVFQLCTSDSKTPSTPCGCPRILRQKFRNGDPATWHRTVTRRSPAQEPAPHEHQHRRQKQTQRGSAATISERPIRSSRPAWSCATLGKAGSGRVALQCTTVRWLSTVCGQTTRRAKLARDGGASERCSARAHGRQCPAPHTAP